MRSFGKLALFGWFSALVLCFLASGELWAQGGGDSSPPRTPGQKVDFSHDVVPILRKHCAECHTGDQKKGGLSFNTQNDLLQGSEHGKVVVPGQGDKSRLIEVVRLTEGSEKMPPKGPRLTAAQVGILKDWIDQGARWDDGFAFKKPAYEPPLKPRRPTLPPALNGRSHPIDRILDQYLATKGGKPLESVSDAAFARRVSLDLIGLLPDPEALRKFVADSSLSKRSQLVKKLLADDQSYAEHWMTFWNDLLRNDYAGTGYIDGGRKQITPWLYQALIRNKPYDQMVRELIAPTPESEGFSRGIKWRGNVSAGQIVPVQFAQSVGQSFLGINLKCASCHDSFIDRWKLSESYGLAAIYSNEPLEIHRCDKPTGKKATPAWLFPEIGQIDPKASQPERIKQLAALMTHPENGRLSRTLVNRLWHQMMGRGIVHPLDAMQSEPWNADLLDFLASDFSDHGYDMRRTLELIATSEAYGSRCQTLTKESEAGPYTYQGPRARRMTAEQFLDAIWGITETAPLKHDAPIARGSRSREPGKKPTSEATWIWSNDHPANEAPAAGETRTFRKVWTLEEVPTRAGAALTCDNGFTLWVNGQEVLSDDHWETIKEVSLTSYLKKGPNEIVISGRNAGNGPNAAGLLFEARAKGASGAVTGLVSNESWQWTARKPTRSGQVDLAGDTWKPVAQVSGSVWNPRIGGAFQQSVANLVEGNPKRVRASLMKSDFLMRTLGRPNREQIVSARPGELTTLEAIDLHNSQLFATLLERGAKNLARRTWESPQALAHHISEAALCRLPTAEENSLYLEILSGPDREKSIEDLLWVVFMLPEFQWVR